MKDQFTTDVIQKKPQREKSPSELGDEVVARVLVEEGIMDPKDLEEYLASFDEPSPQTFPDAGGGDIMGRGANKLYSMQRSNRPVSPVQIFGGNTGPVDPPPAWLAPTDAQELTSIAPDTNAAWNVPPNESIYDTAQGPGEAANPTPVVPEWQTLMNAQDLAYSGVDINAIQAGMALGDWAQQLIHDTHLAPGTSFKDYIWDEIKSGAWLGVEGFRNGIVDLGEADARAWLQAQNIEAQQKALFDDAYREQAERNNTQTAQATAGFPEFAEGFRSYEAAEHARQIDELYDAGGLFKICGDVASGIGQMAPIIAVNILTGDMGGMAYLYTSAAGNAAAEARANGADDDTAFLYGMLSGSIEMLTEQLGGGIPGLNKGVLDDWLMGMAQSNTGRAALKHLANALGEGAEEFISEIAGAYLAQMWSDEKPDFWQTLGDAFYEGLIGTLTSACMSVPGNVAEMRNARTVDTATAAMRNGEVLSGAQLANADSAMQKLTGTEGSDSPWSRIPAREWTDTKSSYFDSFFPQMAELTGKEADLNGIDLSNVIMLPMVKDTEAQANLTADSNAVSSPVANNMTAAQNGQLDLSNVIMLPTGSALEALVRADAEANAASAPAANNMTAAQNGQLDLSNVIMLPTGSELEALVRADAEANAASAPAANNNAAVQNGQPNQSNVIHFPTREALGAGARADSEANAVSATAANDIPTELSAQKTAETNTLQADSTTETATPEMIAEQNTRVRRQALEKGKAKGIELDTAEKLMEVTGLKLQYIYEENSGVDGFNSGDTVTVNLASDTSAFCVAAHEAGHSTKLTDAKKFEAFQTSVQRIIESNPDLKQYAEKIRADYTAESSPALASLTNADGTLNTAALEEDICLKTFEQLIKDPERLVQAVAHDRSAIESFLDVLRGIKNSLVIKFTGSEKAMLDEAERTMVNLLRGEAGTVENARFSIQQSTDGKPYVLIDTDQDIFEGKSVDECVRIARMYMKEHFQGRVMDVGDSRAFVNRSSVNEYTHPANHRLPLDIKTAKMNASTELDNLLSVSEFLRHESDDGRHADVTNGWEVYRTHFVLNGESFVGEVRVKLTDRGKLFYDITHIEKAARID